MDAHRVGNEDLLRRIYGYAAWSFEQRDNESVNAVAVAFYEHLFDEPWMRPLVVPWLNTDVVKGVRALWEARLEPDEMRDVEKLLRD